jgi:dTDP-4-amino-4,6-dideoxygalactose transaminase
MNQIPFNKPYLTGNELKYISEAVASGKISGDGLYTNKCHDFFTKRYGFQKCLLTTSCTDALEMCAILLNIKEGDEIIAPSYTFVSTVNAFVLRGAKIKFVDSQTNNPNIDTLKIEEAISSKTKAIICVHYAGIACDMFALLNICKKHNLFLVEDAAQAIDSYYTFPDGKTLPLGGIGDLSTFSFHETKNIISGEGGMLVINNPSFNLRAEIIREKGTNRSQFFRGEVDKYSWIDIGSSFLPSDIIAAFLFSQLENIDEIQNKRKELWNNYNSKLETLVSLGKIRTPKTPEFSSNNAHMFYIICNSLSERSNLIEHLKNNNVMSVFHYLSLNKSEYFNKENDNIDLTNSDIFSDTLLRLPLYYELNNNQVGFICDTIISFYTN